MSSNADNKLSHRWTVGVAVFFTLALGSATAWGVGGGHGGGGFGGGGGGHFSGGFGGGHGGYGGGHFAGHPFGAPVPGTPGGFQGYAHFGHEHYPYLDHGPVIGPYIYFPYGYGYPYGYDDPYGFDGGYYAQCDPQVPGYTPQYCD